MLPWAAHREGPRLRQGKDLILSSLGLWALRLGLALGRNGLWGWQKEAIVCLHSLSVGHESLLLLPPVAKSPAAQDISVKPDTSLPALPAEDSLYSKLQMTLHQHWGVRSSPYKQYQASFRKAVACAAEHSTWDLKLGTQWSQVLATTSLANEWGKAEAQMHPKTWTHNLHSTYISFYPWNIERIRWTLRNVRIPWSSSERSLKPRNGKQRATILQNIPGQNIHLFGTWHLQTICLIPHSQNTNKRI